MILCIYYKIFYIVYFVYIILKIFIYIYYILFIFYIIYLYIVINYMFYIFIYIYVLSYVLFIYLYIPYLYVILYVWTNIESNNMVVIKIPTMMIIVFFKRTAALLMRHFNDSPPLALRLLAPGAAAREECVTAFLLSTGTMWGWKWGIYPLVVWAVAAKSSLLVDMLMMIILRTWIYEPKSWGLSQSITGILFSTNQHKREDTDHLTVRPRKQPNFGGNESSNPQGL